MKLKKIIQKVIPIVFYILITIGIIMILQKLTNHSPIIDQISLVILSAIITILFVIYGKLAKLETEQKHINKKLDIIGKDLKEHLLNQTS